MRRLSTTLVVLVCLTLGARAAHAQVGATSDGLPGLVRLPAPTAPAPGLGLAVTLDYGYTGDVLGMDDTHHRTGASAALAWRALPWLGLALRLDGRHDAHRGDAGDDDGWILDSRLAARASWPVADALRLGVDLGVWFTGQEAFVPELGATSLDLAGALAWRAAPSLTLIARGGFRLDRSSESVDDPAALSPADRLGLGLAESNAALLGVGAHLAVGRGELSAEVGWDLLVGDGAPAPLESPLRLGLGARWPVGGGWHVAGAVEVGLSERPTLMPDALVPVEPRLAVLVVTTYQLGGRSRAVVVDRDGDGGGGDGDTGVSSAPKPRTIRGRLVDPTGAPIAGAGVRAGDKHTTTDADGRFELAGVPADVAEVVIEPPPPWASRTAALGPGETELALGDLPIERATPPGQVRGLVRSSGGKPLAAVVTVQPGGASVTTGADGNFQLDVPPGAYDVTITAPGHRPQTRHVVVEQDGVTLLNVDLLPQRGSGK